MNLFLIAAATRNGVGTEFAFDSLDPTTRESNGFTLRLGGGSPCACTVTPPAGETITSIAYRLTVPLKNYHQVIVPDTGRLYAGEQQLVSFWGRTFQSRVNNIRMPVFLFTGQNMMTQLAFGVIGGNYETDYAVLEPTMRRALLTWMKRLSLEIRRGVPGYPIPDSIALAQPDGSITEHLLFEQSKTGDRNWVVALREFSYNMAGVLGTEPQTTPASLEPYWCSWTDWDSSQVTDRVILENVQAGMALGIRNYIIDDGWFGPGLDSDPALTLTMGDWTEDPDRVPDLRAMAGQIRREGGRAILWCAPHAVAPGARCVTERRPFVMENSPGVPVLTSNGYHPLCFRCPEAREIMAEICAGLITRYDIDGAKYDLFNNIPGEPCVSAGHRHDTSSTIEGLSRTLELIHRRTTALKPDFITELKQNYATPWLYRYGTSMRAGDTPYNPEGNFLRSAFVAAYTPYGANDYQTITEYDSLDESIVMVIKMLAVGIPTYSMDLTGLDEPRKRMLRFYHEWYLAVIQGAEPWRTPLDAALGCWMLRGGKGNSVFLVNTENRIDLPEIRDSQIVNGTFRDIVFVRFPHRVSFDLSVRHPFTNPGEDRRFDDISCAELPSRPGDIFSLRFRNSCADAPEIH